MKTWFSAPIRNFVAVVVLLSGVLYTLSDHYLNAFGRELMLSWSRSEAAAVQEGNLLTSVMKAQPYLMASDYVQGVALFKIQDGQRIQKMGFGTPFEPELLDLQSLEADPTVLRVGFLHSHVLYPIPGKSDFVLVFDLSSPSLTRSFLAAVWVLILVLTAFVVLLRRAERKEIVKREQLLKLALDDLIYHDSSSEILEREFVEVAQWWKAKKRELREAQRFAVESKSRILLGDMASRLVHDIKGPLRNIEVLTRRMTGLSDAHAEHLRNSIAKIAGLSTLIAEKTRETLAEEIARKVNVDVTHVVRRVVAAKKQEWSAVARVEISGGADLDGVCCFLDPLELDRALSNLIDNAVESLPHGASVDVSLARTGNRLTVRISDCGRGISPENLRKIGSKGFTFGKERGSGLGVYSAKKTVQEAGGTFEISSAIGQGTKVILTFPVTAETVARLPNFTDAVFETIVFLDDSELMHEASEAFVRTLTGAGVNIPIQRFRTPREFHSWVSGPSGQQRFFVFVDYRFEGIDENGLDVIEQACLQSRSALLTAFPDDPNIISRAQALGVPVLSKEFVFSDSPVFN